MKNSGFSAPTRQHGMALIVVLVLVLLVTLAGVAAVRTLTLQERMASNSFDRSLALQSVDRVLRYAEQLALTESLRTPLINTSFKLGIDAAGFSTYGGYNGSCSSPTNTDPSPCQNGYCSQPSPSCATRWSDPNFTGWTTVTAAAISDAANATADGDATLSVGLQHQYMIEFLGKRYPCDPSNATGSTTCTLYRITARAKSVSGTDRAMVQVQSHYLAQ